MVNGTEKSICKSVAWGITADFSCVYAYQQGKIQHTEIDVTFWITQPWCFERRVDETNSVSFLFPSCPSCLYTHLEGIDSILPERTESSWSMCTHKTELDEVSTSASHCHICKTHKTWRLKGVTSDISFNGNHATHFQARLETRNSEGVTEANRSRSFRTDFV